MTDAFERGPAVGDIAVVKTLHRIGLTQPLEQGRIQVEGHPDLAVVRARNRLGNDQLFVATPCTGRWGQVPAVGHQEVVNVVRDAHVVDIADQILELRQDHCGQCAKAVEPGVGLTPRRRRIS